MTQYTLDFRPIEDKLSTAIINTQNLIKNFTLINKDDIYEMIIQNKQIYQSLNNFDYISHKFINLYKLFNPEITHKENLNYLNDLIDTAKLLNSNIKYLTNIDGYFILMNHSKKHNRNLKNLLITNIYIAEDKNGLIKIGKSINVHKRIKDFKTSNPFIKLHSYYPTLKIDKAEHTTHLHFKNNHIEGEWFSINPNKVSEYLKSHFCLDTGHNIINGLT